MSLELVNAGECSLEQVSPNEVRIEQNSRRYRKNDEAEIELGGIC